jgi:Na+/citrate or Na+/malate symporter
MGLRIGIAPVPVFALLIATLAWLVRLRQVPGEICAVIAIMTVGGFACAEIGRRLPGLRAVGGAAILATFVPSALAYYHLLPRPLLQPMADFLKSTNFLYLFITAIIVGSIFGMDRQTLIKGFTKIFVPLAAGSVVAALVGTGVGAALGLGARHTLFYTVVPIMAGGVGEGAIPLSLGYAERLHQDQGETFGLVLPPVMLGSLTAILLAGLLNHVGKLRPSLTGEGRLEPANATASPAERSEGVQGEGRVPAKRLVGLRAPSGARSVQVEGALGGDGAEPGARETGREGIRGAANFGGGGPGVATIAAAGITAISLYLLGVLVHALCGLPAPVAMLFLAVAAKLARAIPADLQRGAFVVYDFFRVAVVYPLLFMVGAAITPWDKLMAALHPANIVTIVATVASLIGTGFIVGRWMGMYPIEAAIVNATHSGQGGTGDVAILTAANRMELLPFAQVATRIGGAITVTLALIALSRLG